MMKDKSLVVRFFKEECWQSISATTRWNSIPRIKDESLRDHLFLCAMFGRVIVEELFGSDKPYLVKFKLDTITACLFHDFDEAFTGDILHHVKYNQRNGSEFRNAIESFIDHKLDEELDRNIDSQKMLRDSIETKDKNIKGIVKVVDWLTCLHYVESEKRLGNQNFNNYIELCKTKLFEAIEISKYDLNFNFPHDCNFTVYNEIKEFIVKQK